jgi:hypothetical protein
MAVSLPRRQVFGGRFFALDPIVKPKYYTTVQDQWKKLLEFRKKLFRWPVTGDR